MNADQEKVKDSEHLQLEKEQVEDQEVELLEATLIKLMKPCRKQTSPPSEPAQQFLDIFEPSQFTRQTIPTVSKHVHFELSKDPQMS
uniref:BESS domain-containing protein n=1 Tax=Rhabditophanes sp. KR3021 TaxID=114890 RepID=A0AC35TWU0_9BILA